MLKFQYVILIILINFANWDLGVKGQILKQSQVSRYADYVNKCLNLETDCYNDALTYIQSFFGGSGQSTSYFAIIDINSLSSILENGWYIYLNNKVVQNSQEFQKILENQYKHIVVFTGPFNVGKTFITNKIAKSNLASGNTLHTSGISIYMDEHITYIDTEGHGNPVRNDPDYIRDRKLTDQFIEMVSRNITNEHIFVINRLSIDIQESIIKYAKQSERGNTRLLLVHNFKDLKTMKEVDDAISRDILNVYEGARRDLDKDGKVYFESSQIMHFILASEGSEAGKFYNENTYELIRNQIVYAQNSRVTKQNLYQALITAMEKELQRYVQNTSSEMVLQPQAQGQSYLDYFKGIFGNSDRNEPQIIMSPTNVKIVLEDQVDSKKGQQLPRPPRLIIKNSEDLAISNKLQSINGDISIDLNDKFMPKYGVSFYVNENNELKQVIEVELGDSIPTTNLTLFSKEILIEGQKPCTGHSYEYSNIQCGRFILPVEPPNDLEFAKPSGRESVDNTPLIDDKAKKFSSCKDGVCKIEVTIEGKRDRLNYYKQLHKDKRKGQGLKYDL